MAAKTIVSSAAILKALRRFSGNVVATARYLRIRPKSLYERINRERIPLPDFRKLHAGQSSNPYDPFERATSDSYDPLENAPFTESEDFTMVRGMKAQLDPEVDVVRSRRTLRVPHQLAEGLQFLRLQLWKKSGVEYDETALLEHFAQACFKDWAASMLADPDDSEHRGKK